MSVSSKKDSYPVVGPLLITVISISSSAINLFGSHCQSSESQDSIHQKPNVTVACPLVWPKNKRIRTSRLKWMNLQGVLWSLACQEITAQCRWNFNPLTKQLYKINKVSTWMIKQCKGLYHPVPSRVFYLFLLSISYMKVYKSYKPFGSTEIQSIKNTGNKKLRCVEKPQIFCSFSNHLSEKKSFRNNPSRPKKNPRKKRNGSQRKIQQELIQSYF